MEKLPGEVLDLIIGELSDSWEQCDLYGARLVCQTWNQFAIRLLFSTVTFYTNDESMSNDFRSWNRLMDLQSVKNTVQRVIIQTCPRRSHQHEVWKLWEERGQWPAFRSAINRIAELGNLTALEIHFNPPWGEGPSARRFAMEAVYQALKQREERASRDGSVKLVSIQELRLENLQNIDPPDALGNGLLKGIKRLHLNILGNRLIRYTSYGDISASDYRVTERLKFDDILRNKILVPVMNQLVELNISSHYEWGLLPSRFNGNGLMFPNLRTLILSDFYIGHYDQLDWVFDQKTLTCLRLQHCHVVTHFRFQFHNHLVWNVDINDWATFDGEPWFAGESGSNFFSFNLRWNTIFDNIRESLPNLTDFGTTWRIERDPCADAYSVPSMYNMTGRYMVFDDESVPGGFTTYFGDPRENDKINSESPWSQELFSYEKDASALHSLLQTVHDRRRRVRYF
ncbi:hypothetical protein FLONG3_3623 [Fusarium longipes]|uniref:F-box domain-containing protein n=1 Tax=Fusarium longipes TaxID=694270 RepID=A0A395T0S5_9HYPO|nr:hypothetical protein FLONG3_3623 [Fusarium longipes]